MTHFQTLETEKYWNEVRDEEINKEVAGRNKNAIEAFATFLVGLILIATINAVFVY